MRNVPLMIGIHRNIRTTGQGLVSEMDGQGRHSIYTKQGQEQLSAARHEAVDRMIAVVRHLVGRVNQKGCGLVMEFAMAGPGEGRISFHLLSKPGSRIFARVDGGLLVLAGRTFAGREEFQSMIKMIVRNLALGHYDHDEAAAPPVANPAPPVGPSGRAEPPKEPGRGLVPVSRPTASHGTGFVREISLD